MKLHNKIYIKKYIKGDEKHINSANYFDYCRIYIIFATKFY